jgi:hypothetical protein
MNPASCIKSFDGVVTAPFDLLGLNQRWLVEKTKLFGTNLPLSAISTPASFILY